MYASTVGSIASRLTRARLHALPKSATLWPSQAATNNRLPPVRPAVPVPQKSRAIFLLDNATQCFNSLWTNCPTLVGICLGASMICTSTGFAISDTAACRSLTRILLRAFKSFIPLASIAGSSMLPFFIAPSGTGPLAAFTSSTLPPFFLSSAMLIRPCETSIPRAVFVSSFIR